MSQTMKRYRLPDGRILWVGHAFGRWMTMDSDPASPGRRRFKSKNLPDRALLEEAQADLDAWAKKGRLPEVAE
jgi:hypothetical protein